jgi:hypothetical protein
MPILETGRTDLYVTGTDIRYCKEMLYTIPDDNLQMFLIGTSNAYSQLGLNSPD